MVRHILITLTAEETEAWVRWAQTEKSLQRLSGPHPGLGAPAVWASPPSSSHVEAALASAYLGWAPGSPQTAATAAYLRAARTSGGVGGVGNYETLMFRLQSCVSPRFWAELFSIPG